MATSFSIASPKSTSRRLPPPCWSHDETVALIEVYRDKWYSLQRGNLRAPDWQEVADGVAARCPLGNPPKTSIQCRHKMEKLRKRYRSEIQRIGNAPKGQRFPSAWVHFKLMESMELGTSCSDPSVDRSNQDDEEEEEDNEDDLMLYPKRVKQPYPVNRNLTGVRIKIPNFAGGVRAPPATYNNTTCDDLPPPVRPQYGSGEGLRNGYSKGGVKRGKEDMMEKSDGVDVMNAMVGAIQKLGDGFVKMERMKMDMARELESMRMKAEIKQTEIILETHRKLWESFSETVVEKRSKKMKAPES